MLTPLPEPQDDTATKTTLGRYVFKKTRHAGNKQTMRVRMNSFIVDKYSVSNFSRTYTTTEILKSIELF